MSIFDSIKHAIFGDKGIMGSGIGAGHAAPAASPTAGAPVAPAIPMGQAPAPSAQGTVDVDAVLTQKAAAYGKPNNWRTSIVDLMTLLGMDSSLSARKELGDELNIQAGPDGSAEQNIALHKAVMAKLAQNGGKVPADLLN